MPVLKKFRKFSNAEKKIKEIVDEACKQYGCKIYIESDVNGKLVLVGLTAEELNNTIGRVSFVMNHNTVSTNLNGHTRIYDCSSCLDKRADGKA